MTQRPFPHYMEHLRPIIQEEMESANPYTTLYTIYLRVSQHIDECLGIGRRNRMLENRLYVDPEIALAIDNLWLEFVSADVQLSQEDCTAYEKFKANDYLRPIDIAKLIKSLLSRSVSSRDPPSSTEKILIDVKLCIVFAMDGFGGCFPQDVKNYIENLSVGNSVCVRNRDKHVKGIRDMYRAVSGKVNGTDACQLVFLSLLTLYRDYTNDAHIKVILDEKTASIRDDLVKHAQAYPILSQLATPQFLAQLAHIYRASGVIVEKIAAFKLSAFYSKGKRAVQKNKKQRKGDADSICA